MVFVKQFGLQRSGTNIIKALIEVNFKDVLVLTNTLGNKHIGITWEEMAQGLKENPPAEDYLTPEDLANLQKLIASRNLNTVINLKDPISWLESYFRYSKNKLLNKNPEAKWELTIEFCKNNLPKWKKNVSLWLQYASEGNNCHIITHEEILTQPELVIKSIEEKFLLADKRIAPELTYRFEDYAKPGTEQHRGTDLLYKGKKFDSSYHTEKMWVENFPTDALGYSLRESSLMRDKFPELAPFIPKYL